MIKTIFRLILMHPLRTRGIRIAGRDLPRSLSRREAGYQDKEQWDKNEVDECRGEHPAGNRGPNGIHGAATGAGSDGQRQYTEEKSQ